MITHGKRRGTDKPFLRLMEVGGGGILKLLGIPSDEAEQYRFRSVVLKEKRLEPDIEGIPILEGKGKRVFIEFQGYRDKFIRHRLIAKVMMACALDGYQGKVVASIIYTDMAWKKAALTVAPFEEKAGCGFTKCLSEIVLTEYTEKQLKEIDSRLVALAPFTVSKAKWQNESLSLGRKWKNDVEKTYSKDSVRDVLNVMGLFIMNRFRDVSREEVMRMLNFDLMDTVAGQEIYEEGIEKGIERGLLSDAHEMVIEALEERFGIVSEEIMDNVHSIGRREILRELLRRAIRSENIEDFKEMLAKAI